MKFSGYLILTLAFAALSCRKNANPIAIEFVEPSLGAITYQQTDYDSFSIGHSSGSKFISKDIVAIAVGEIDSSGFHVQDSSSMVFDPLTNTYVTDFNASISFDLKRLSLSLRVRYYRVLGAWIDFDTTLSTITYPYPGTEIIWNTAPPQNAYAVEDIDISDSTIYGQINDFILMYDMRTGTTSQVQVGSYEVVAVVDNRYLFYDHNNWSLYRYDLLTDSMQQFVYHPSGRFMMGLEYNNGALYELLWDNPVISLLKYSLSGQLLDSVALDRNCSRLTILNGIAYFEDWSTPQKIRQFDLSSKTFIGEFKAPAANYEGIRIRGGYFYFSDFNKRTVSRFPLNELFTYGPI